MPMYNLCWSERRAITKEFASVEAANDWWQNADSDEIEDELDYSDCSDLEIEEADNQNAVDIEMSLPYPECDCPICTILRAEMADSQREIAVYHLSDPGDHPELNEAEFGNLIKQELDHIFGAGECPDCIMGKCPEHGVEDDAVFPLGLHPGDEITIGIPGNDVIAGTIVEIKYLLGRLSNNIEAANIVLSNGWRGPSNLNEIS